MIRRAVTRRAVTRRGDEGLSLVEVLIAVALTVSVLGIACTALISGQRASTRTVDRLQSTDGARVAVEAMSRELRTAVRSGSSASAVLRATPSSVEFYAHDRPVPPAPVGTGPTRVTYRVDVAGDLLEERVPAGTWDAASRTYGYAATPARRVLARGVTPEVFRYHTAVTSGCLRTSTCPSGPLDATGALAAADLPLVRAVSLSLRVSTGTVGGGSDATVRTFVALANGAEPVTG